MIRRELLAIDGLDKTSPSFQRKLVEVADRLGLTASYLAAVIRFESGFDPTANNPRSGAVGLIQFMPSKNGVKGSAEILGTTTTALSKMSALRQLDYVEAFYEKVIAWKGSVDSLEDHYLAVIAPAFIGTPPDGVVYRAPDSKYTGNKELDSSGDGTLTAYELTSPVRGFVADAEGKAPIIVDMDAPLNGDAATDIGVIGAAAVIAIMAWAFSRYKYRARLA